MIDERQPAMPKNHADDVRARRIDVLQLLKRYFPSHEAPIRRKPSLLEAGTPC
jgi:hypothetical protein